MCPYHGPDVLTGSRAASVLASLSDASPDRTWSVSYWRPRCTPTLPRVRSVTSTYRSRGKLPLLAPQKGAQPSSMRGQFRLSWSGAELTVLTWSMYADDADSLPKYPLENWKVTAVAFQV